ncbi:molybdate ABC transporter permease subunit [Clostridium botulinum]|uniref:Molybdenum transport system permease n=1 Tax=Clostridium botulinum (strain Langeland / NCTC 10281 / Type F) TaxID=441772 RepID=A7GDH1_CLOBL|nr:molybdate ABC transporter permease subunit [Clostridium botulinum]ABS42719.1 molybdate ABC transporter, permease protein [Clostridium botulinum F str. Langeland]KKM43161.1 molybdenum ABC transporter permease [Clostridium botulinum]MBD5643118.1 molybdate ABC transporter permease subunit [Clostridium botulinum]MBY6791321.1 molybdate ABC transporter permease subunit [Clostridium botulinum]MBY6936552.1 molybdate ABC transporter permease subunit [Clostridium botulinum]
MILQPIILSLKVAFISTIFTFIFGILLARVCTKFNFKGKDILESLIILPMVLPPTITGYGLLILMSKRNFMGKFLYENFGITIIFTPVAACVAATIVSIPLMYQSAKAAFLNIDHIYENAARTLGASEWRIFLKISFPLAWPGIVSGSILSFARSLGEFGATLMVAGNIPGKTQTIPTAIYFAVDNGYTKVANILLGIVVVFSFVLIFSLNSWLKKKDYKRLN